MNFTPEIIEKIWEKSTIVEGQDKQEFRKDIFGAWICRKFYNNNRNQYGWEIGYEHLTEDSNNNIDNLIPLQWENKELIDQGISDCRVTANRIRNELVKIKDHEQDTL